MDFYSLNPMDYQWNLIPPIPGSFWMDIFEIILLTFSWTLNSKIECPQRRYVFPKFNPCTQGIKNLDSAIISLNHVACYIGKCFNVLTHPPPVIIHLSYDGFFCSCKCELAATASKQTPFVPLLHTTHCRGDLLPTHGGGLSWDDN